MSESDYSGYTSGEKIKPRCFLCQGTGFYIGKVCVCIGKKQSNLPPIFRDLFDGIFHDNQPDKGKK